ncbi:hypothetical protein HWC53_gp118 [Bacillus phage vB_BmeM-Goe8]|uniref:Uncharacterized protein n=1 Tax=Bacillus phage vB_BmeM-Goe8 TaxID=2593638 RepID=A0A516KMZ1_9CAUD|nr:hypothetical protein HWC53_gp118 [Bacillus phage vB_BmeM-Goe8]QDP42971.1 hypothetical protein Goe8_c01980 [Bacillus phage vB_BmeM-Goe8]
MSGEELRDTVAEANEEMLFANGFDDAIIGYIQRAGGVPVALYDTSLCIAILVKEGMSEEDALEHFDYNVVGSYVGENTPVFATLLSREDFS